MPRRSKGIRSRHTRPERSAHRSSPGGGRAQQLGVRASAGKADWVRLSWQLPPRLLDFFEGGDDAFSTRIHAHRRNMAPADDSIRIDYEQRALTHALALTIRTILPRDRAFWFEVREERKMQFTIFAERGVTPR